MGNSKCDGNHSRWLRRLIIWMVVFTGVTAFSSVEFRERCQNDCEQSLDALPLRGKEFGSCDWECRVGECKYGCTGTNYSLIGTSLDGCLAQCAALNRTSACESGCVSGNLQLVNYIRRNTAIAKLLKAQATAPTKIDLTWEVGDVCLEASVVWRAQVRHLDKSRSGEWMTSAANIGITGSTVLNTVIDGDTVKAGSKHEVRLAAFLRSRIVAYSPAIMVEAPTASSSPGMPVFVDIPDFMDSPNEKITCWKIPDGSAISNYTVTVRSKSSQDLIRNETITTNCIVLRHFLPGETYAIGVRSRSSLAESAEASTTFTIAADTDSTKEHSVSTQQLDALPLIYANKSHVWKSADADDYLVSHLSGVYRTQDTVEITAIAAVNSTIYIALSSGNVMEVKTDDPKAAPVIAFHITKHADQVSAMAVDWLSGNVYLAAIDKVIVCRSKNANCTAFSGISPDSPISALAVEPRLGYLYFATASGIFYISLSDFPQSRQPKILLHQQGAGAGLSLDSSLSFLLYIAVNSTIYEHDLITRTTTETRNSKLHPGTRRDHSGVTSLTSHNGRHWWISQSCSKEENSEGSCMFGEEETGGDIQIQRFTLPPGHGRLVGVAVPMTAFAPLLPDPEDVSALFSDEAIRLVWSPPAPLPFQAPNLDIPFHYNVTLRLDGQLVLSASVNDSRHDHIFEHVQPRALYIMSMRTCWREFCSPGVVTWGKTMANGDLLKSVDLIVAGNTTVGVYDMLGKPMASYGSAPSTRKVRWLAATSAYGDLLAVDEENCLFSIDSSKKWTPLPFSPCMKINGSLSCFRHEKIGDMVYWCEESGVYRTHVGSWISERISAESNVQSLALFSSEAIAVIQQPDYVLGVQLTGSYYKTYYTCATNDCEILGICTVNGFHDSRLYILVAFHTSGSMEMHSTLYDGSAHELLGQTNGTLNVRSMTYYFGKFLLQLDDGRLAITDADLQIVNYFPLGNVEAVAFHVPGSSQETHASINVTSINVSATKSGSMLFSWSAITPLSSSQNSPPTFYNVTISPASKPSSLSGFFFQSIVSVPVLETDLVPANEEVQVTIVPFDYWKPSQEFSQAMKTPSASPSSPRNTRMHVDHVESPYGPSARVTLLWDEPRWNGAPKGFNVSCWSYSRKSLFDLSEKQPKQQVHKDPQRQVVVEVELGPQQRMLAMNGLATNLIVSCQVTASNVGVGASRPTNMVEIDTSAPRPSSVILMAKPDGLYAFDVESGSTVATLGSGPVNTIGNLRESIFAVEADNLLVQNDGDLSSQFNPVPLGLNSSIAFRSLAIDWVGRNVFLSGQEPRMLAKGDSIWKFNLDSKRPAENLYSVSGGVRIVNMLHDPFQNILYFITSSGKKLQLQRLKLGTLELDLQAPDCSLISPAIASNMPGSRYNSNSSMEVLVITDDGIVNAAKCKPVVNVTSNITWSSVQDLVFQRDSIILSTKTQLYRLEKATGQISDIKLGTGNINDIRSYNLADQPLPDIACLQYPIDTATDYRVYPINKTAAQIDIDISPLMVSIDHCSGTLSIPVTRHLVSICELPSDAVKTVNWCRNYDTYDSKQLITGLLENVTYDVRVEKANFYANGTHSNVTHSQTFNTSQVMRLAPAKLRARTLTPDKVMLTWEQPGLMATSGERMNYKITVLSKSKVKIQEQDDIECQINPCQHVVTGLKPNTNYAFRVAPIGDKRPSELEVNNNEALAVTRQSPGTLMSINSNFTADSLALVWQPSNDTHIRNWAVQYSRVAEDAWRDVILDDVGSNKKNGVYFVRLTKLRPLTQYKVRLVVLYDSGFNYTEEYTYITNGKRRPRASGTVPAAPVNFRIEEKPKNSGKKNFMWEEPDEGGSQILKYQLEQQENENAKWTLVANNIPAVPTEYPVYPTIRITPTTQFRLAAINKEGIGKWAYLKAGASGTDGAGGGTSTKTVGIIVAVCVIVVLILVVITVLLACRKRICGRRRQSPKTSFDALSRPLPGYQRRDGSSHLDALSQISKDDLDALPHVSRSCITASKPLGQGAFGEVYEGLACNLPRIGPKTVRVAIKTLKEGSPDVERVKFLKEAILMSKFRHPNIVQLLGVCIESEPHWIILELMEGGDLLTYLRLARATETMPSQVTLEDLVTLAIDVARGCSHLEQHHHVHRDLAARNCLLSSRDPAQRVVKIADFGMARDVYEGDYYRVEGHGLLPVRWMAPESMIDGVFTTKTDVWSFGVLLWEIMTLGQQPYPGRTNWDVLNYVRIGGRLKAPEYCPNELYEVMNACWSFEAKDRPSFTEIVERLEALRSLPQFQSDIPFPPFYPRAPSSADSKENSSSVNQGPSTQPSDPQVQLFVTQASGRFQRNTKQPETQSTRTNKLRKAAELLSFRKQKEVQPPPPPPSKNEIDAGRTTPTSLGVPTTPDTRPTSGESFTTSAEGYEVPLLKNLRSAAGGFTNRGYEPTTPGSMTPGPSMASIAEPGVANVYMHERVKSPDAPRIKPNAPKPPLKPEVVHLSSSPQSARRAQSPEITVPTTSYENVQHGHRD